MGGAAFHHGDNHARGPSKVLLFGTLSFIGIVFYVLVITHHLRIDSTGLHLQAHQNQVGEGRTAVLNLARRPPVDPAAANAFVERMESLGTLERYDKDGDKKLNAEEFQRFLIDLSRSKILDPQVLGNLYGAAADLVVGPSKQRKANEPKQPTQTQSTGGSIAVTSTTPQPRTLNTQPLALAETKTVVQQPKVVNKLSTCPELTRELVAEFAVNQTIMLTVSDWRIFETFGVSWMKHLKRLNVDYYLVGATDKQTSSFLAGQGRHPCFKFFEDGHGHAATQEYRYGDSHYNAATWRKVVVVQQIVSWGFNVIHSDVDVVWFRNPLPYFLGPAVQHADVAVSTDLISTRMTEGDDGLERDVFSSVNLNTGVYFVKTTPGGRAFMTAWAGRREVSRHENDQIGLYGFIRGRDVDVNHEKRYMQLYADNDKTPIRIGLLGSHMLLNGYSYFIPKLHTKQKVQPLGIHLTWVPLSREGKFHRMRDGMLYNDVPEYYTEPLFLTADLDFPPVPPEYNAEKDTEKMIVYHLQSMDKQLVQMYRAMAVNVIMNRTLVLPKLKCFCYKNWFMMEQCRIPGDKATQFPLDCEMDQWLRPKVIYGYGPNIDSRQGKRSFMFREHTLFSNPNFPQELLKQQVIVRAGDPNIQPVVEEMDVSKLNMVVPGVTQGKIKVVTLPPLMKQDALKAALDKLVGNAKIIRLIKPYELFGGWDDQTLKQSFETFLDKVAGNWCCRDKPFVQKGLKEKEKLAIHW